MPTLSQFALNCLALLRRVPFWAQAFAFCALFAVAGVLALDDYGIGRDEIAQREIAVANADYIASGDISELFQDKDIAYRYYGMAFEMPLLLAERALGLQDSRHIYLTRHLLIHLSFIAGGFACGMLAYRMLGSRWIALFAMLMFLLHPRLYAHSFVNTKDIPFAALFVIALYLAHRAFRKDTIGAFLMCGVGVGLAIDLRPFGLLLLPAMLAMRAPDLWQAGRAERKRILLSSAAFLAATLATVYAVHPYYWENPLRFVEGIRVVAQHPVNVENLYMGKIYFSNAVPWNFVPVWFGITAPPIALLLGATGCAAVCWRAITRPLAALRDRETRFRILMIGCFALPVVVVIALQSNLYNGWRQMYFLWGPFCLLAAVGLRSLAGSDAAEGAARGVAARLPGWVRGGGRLHMARRAFAYGAAGFGLITTLTAMAALHPHQQVYFNALTDTKTPDALAKRYDMDYWHLSRLQAMEHLLALYPGDTLRVWPEQRSIHILPQNDRERIINAGVHEADFYLNPRVKRRNIPNQPKFHSIQAYGSDITFTLAPNSDAYRAAHQAAYNDVEANGALLARSDVDIYIHNGELRYLTANCAPTLANADYRLFLHTFPINPADLSPDSRELGFENRDFWITDRFAFFDGKCIHNRPLPDYPIVRIRTGNDGLSGGNPIWRADIDLAARAAAQAVYDGIVSGYYGQPAAQSGFDAYLRGNRLAYFKEPCDAGDAEARFFLHIFPADSSDLPADRRDAGFVNHDFQLTERGALIDGKCVASRELPDYAIDRIRTGQFVSGEGQLWSAEFPVER